MNDPLTFDLIYDLAQSSSCALCPILNDYNDIIQRSFTAEVRASCRTAITDKLTSAWLSCDVARKRA